MIAASPAHIPPGPPGHPLSLDFFPPPCHNGNVDSFIDPAAQEVESLPARRGPAKMRYSHVAMVDVIVQNPWVRQNDLAAMFGRTPAWISTIMQADAFKALLEERRAELVDPELRISVRERFEALVHRSLQVLQEKLSVPRHEDISDNLALRAAELGAKSLGFGLPAAAPIPAGGEDRLTSLASRLVELQLQVRRNTATVIEEVPHVEVLPVPRDAAPQGAADSPPT